MSIRGERCSEGEPGELVSLLPVHGPAEGVTTEGSRTRSAERRSSPARAGASRTSSWSSGTDLVERGVLLAIRPGTAA